MQTVTTYYLHMLSPSALVAKDAPEGLKITEAGIRQFQVNRFLYQFIGEKWQWTDKLSWSDAQWREFVESDRLRTWIAHYEGTIAGYYELLRQGDEVEILYFGLAEAFIGRGFGGDLLSEAIRSAWEWQGTKRVWVHTCTLDHPGALRNYLSRGMTIFKEETAAY